MKYVVFLVIDAFHYKSIGLERTGYSPTPFLDELFKGGAYFTNVFSQAPFTDGATYGLYSGQNALEGSSYMFNLRDVRRTLGEVFRDNGYDTHTNLTAHPHVQGFKRGFNQAVYATSAAPGLIWYYRLRYYAALRSQAGLDAADYDVVCDLLRDNFVVAKDYLSSVFHETAESACVRHMISDRGQLVAIHDFLEDQQSLFLQDERRYARQVLDRGAAHPLFTRCSVRYDPIDVHFRQYARRRLAPLLGRSLLRAARHALPKGRVHVNALDEAARYLLRLARKGKVARLVTEVGKHVVTHPRAWLDVDLIERFRRPLNGVKAGLDHALGVLTSAARSNREQRVFVLSHVDGLHAPVRFLSTDRADRDLLERELRALEVYLAEVEPRSPFLLSYDYALCYVDQKVREFVEALRQAGLWGETALIITSDHGSSFTGATRRKNTVNNFYDESYNVPLAIAGGAIQPRRIDSLASSIDVASTVLDVLGLGGAPLGDGTSIVSRRRAFVTLEHYGSGCPDWRRRGRNVAVRSEGFKVVYAGDAPTHLFEPSSLIEVYDLARDPGETTNLARKARSAREVGQLVEVVRDRLRLASASVSGAAGLPPRADGATST